MSDAPPHRAAGREFPRVEPASPGTLHGDPSPTMSPAQPRQTNCSHELETVVAQTRSGRSGGLGSELDFPCVVLTPQLTARPQEVARAHFRDYEGAERWILSQATSSRSPSSGSRREPNAQQNAKQTHPPPPGRADGLLAASAMRLQALGRVPLWLIEWSGHAGCCRHLARQATLLRSSVTGVPQCGLHPQRWLA